MERRQLLLAALSPARGEQHTPVQVQKLMFLLDKEASSLTGGPYYGFVPYDYGPFDSDVYADLRALAAEGKVELIHNGRWTNYRLTSGGQAEADEIFTGLDPRLQTFVQNVSQFVRGLSFSQLVRAIYKAYPEMKANSVFQD